MSTREETASEEAESNALYDHCHAHHLTPETGCDECYWRLRTVTCDDCGAVSEFDAKRDGYVDFDGGDPKCNHTGDLVDGFGQVVSTREDV